jgi:hypothetical protein
MKKFLFFLLFIVFFLCGFAQKTDSLPAKTQAIALSVSTPQPRLNETFEVEIDISHVKAYIFRSIRDKVQETDMMGHPDDWKLSMNVYASKKGLNEVGPLIFNLDDTRYTTNKVVYEVVDPLPDTDRGLWFRQVRTSEHSFCIIIDQRIPADTKTTQTSENSISYTTEAENDKYVKVKRTYSIKGVSSLKSNTSTSYNSVVVKGAEKKFLSCFSIYYFTIEDPDAKIKITKDLFENIPPDHKFQDIIIQ